MMCIVRVLRGLTIGVSAMLLGLQGLCILGLVAGGLLQGVWEWAALAAVGLQAAALLCVTILAACRAEGRWGWFSFLGIEALATVFSVAFGVNWSNPGVELRVALLPLICAVALAGLNAILSRLEKEKKDA